MKIHEYQAKELFATYGIPISEEKLCFTADEVKEVTEEFDCPVVVKAQVLTGGRGKAGGVKLAKTPDQAYDVAEQILGMNIKEFTVEKVLTAKAVRFHQEYYIGLTIDRLTKSVLFMVSAEGGVEIEEVAKETPEKILKFPIDATTGLLPFMARTIAFTIFNDIGLVRQASRLFINLYNCFVETDASLAEINPLVVTANEQLLALDGKMNFDDNALFRQSIIEVLNEPTEDEKLELEAKAHGLSYIKLDGEIGCMVNGAGLAMATMDMIKLYGGNPANFLDIGGSSNPDKVVQAFKYLTSDSKVKVIMINIFGGITRCDDVARGIIKAFESIQLDLPIVIRLAGTNAQEGLEILKSSKLISVASLSEAAQKAVELHQNNAV